MSETRHWYTEPETFVALAALIVSLSALGVGVYEASLQRNHDRAEVWPHVEVEVFTDTDGAQVQVENTGLGPAVVESITASVDGRAQRNWRGVVATLTGDSTQSLDFNTIYEHSLRPGDRVKLLGLTKASMPPQFWNVIGRVVVSICYRSVFEERFVVLDTIGHASHWTSVKTCPAQSEAADF